MSGVTIDNLDKCKRDIDHISEFATSNNLTVTDRAGNTKSSIYGAGVVIDSKVAGVEAKKTAATSLIDQKNADALSVISQKVADASAAIPKKVAEIDNTLAMAMNTMRAAYFGALDNTPTVRPDGSPLRRGDRYFDNLAGAEKTWSAAGWLVPNGDLSALAGPGGADLIGINSTTARSYLAEQDQKPPSYKVATFLKNIKSRPCRMLLIGTSISSFDSSAVQILPRILQNEFGLNGSIINNLGVYGGTYGPAMGHKKQGFGGAGYYRLVLDPAESDLIFSGDVDSISLVYSQELDGGAFDVFIDDVYETTLNSSGAQSYENVWTKDFTPRGYHTITVKAPATGSAYLERIELRQFGAGIYIENQCLGGSGLRHAFQAMPYQPGNKQNIATIANNGLDAIIKRNGVTRPDIIICQHCTNDNDPIIFKSALARMVSETRTAGIPLVLLTEQPAMDFISPAGFLYPAREEIRQIILSFRNERHVSVIDWIGMVDYSNKAQYEAKYFPTADKTHPSVDGHVLPMSALCSLFGVNPPARFSEQSVLSDIYAKNSGIKSQSISDLYHERYRYGEVIVPPIGSLYSGNLTAIAEAIGFYGNKSSVYYSDSALNLIKKSEYDLINNSPTSDQFGAYVHCVSKNSITTFDPQHGVDIEQEYSVVMLVKRFATAVINLNTPANNLKPRVYLRGVYTSQSLITNAISSDVPCLVYFTVRQNLGSTPASAIQIMASGLDVYSIWVTEGAIPVITYKMNFQSRAVGLPLYMQDDESPSRVTVGQTYLEVINNKIIEKKAIDTICWKPLQHKLARIYESKSGGVNKIQIKNPAGLSYNPKFGGYSYSSGEWDLLSVFQKFPFSLRYTLSFRSPDMLYRAVQIFFVNGANNGYVWLNEDGSWSSSFNANLNVITRLPIGSGFSQGGNIAFTFDMPGNQFADVLGANPDFNIKIVGTYTGITPAVLAEGSSACI